MSAKGRVAVVEINGVRLTVRTCLKLDGPLDRASDTVLFALVGVNQQILDSSTPPSWFDVEAAQQVIREARAEQLLRARGFHPHNEGAAR